MLDLKLIPHIKLLWEFNRLDMKLEKADFILVLGSNDLSVPLRAAEIYREGFSSKIITSGGFGRLTRELSKPEAEVFAGIIASIGVPIADIMIENKSTNTGENIKFSYDLAVKNGLKTQKIILVTKSYMEKRALATFQKQWPNTETKVIVTSPIQSFEDLLNDPDIVSSINIMVGDTQRLKIYPKMGFMTETEIPDRVWESFEILASSGFDRELIK